MKNDGRFLAVSATTGDAPTATSKKLEVSPNEATNKLDTNGSFRLDGPKDYCAPDHEHCYYLKNKDFNGGKNFTTYTVAETGTTGNHYLQSVSGADASNEKKTQGAARFTGPINYTILAVNTSDSYQAKDSNTNVKFGIFALKKLLDKDKLNYAG